MSYYPIFLDLNKKPCLVVGGGRVAERKVLSLLSAGALVTVISPRLTKSLIKLASAKKGNKIKHVKKTYAPGDMERLGRFVLVISSTDSKKVNELVSKDAGVAGVLLNVVDNPGLCGFITPSVVDRGSLIVAISSSGKSPLLSKTLKELIGDVLPEELEVLTDILGAVRNKLLKNKVKSVKKIEIYNALIDSPVLEWIGSNDRASINRLLIELLGPGSTLSRLGVRLER